MSWPEKLPDSNPVNQQYRGIGSVMTAGDDEALRQRIRTVVENSHSPITVSKLAERLYATDDESEYGDVHEALYRDHLQNLDAEGTLVFDMELGLVYSSESVADGLEATATR